MWTEPPPSVRHGEVSSDFSSHSFSDPLPTLGNVSRIMWTRKLGLKEVRRAP